MKGIKKYRQWLSELKINIQQAKMRSALQVNKDMLVLYWYIGKQIEIKINAEEWGAKIIEQLSDDLQKEFPDLQGFSVRNLKYMRQFAEAYPDLLIGQQAVAQIENTLPKREKGNARNRRAIIGQQAVAQIENSLSKPIKSKVDILENAIGQQPVAQFGNITYVMQNPLLITIPWGHHLLLLEKVEDEQERMWYITKAVENGWSRAVLNYQVSTDLYTRQHKARKHSNFHLTLPKPQSDLANELLKDPYIFSFLDLGEDATEKDLEKQLIYHIKEFLLELGAGFAYVGKQVRLKAGRKVHAIDLLFYHLHLRSYIVIDLKMNEFEFSYSGQMNGYLNLVNKQLKHEDDNPSIGIILCGGKDSVEVDYALTNITHPIGVSEYNFSKSLPRKFKDQLPTAKQLENEVKKFLRKKRQITTK